MFCNLTANSVSWIRASFTRQWGHSLRFHDNIFACPVCQEQNVNIGHPALIPPLSAASPHPSLPRKRGREGRKGPSPHWRGEGEQRPLRSDAVDRLASRRRWVSSPRLRGEGQGKGETAGGGRVRTGQDIRVHAGA